MMLLKNMVRGSENDSVAKQLIQRWEHDRDTLNFWRASSNFIYEFKRNDIPYFLRFVHEEDNNIDNIQAELDFMNYLRAEGYSTVAPVLSTNGHSIETLTVAGEGRYFGVVFEQARGDHLPLEQMTYQQIEDWGRSLATLHILSKSYSSEGVARGSWEDALTFVSSVLELDPGEREARQELENLRHHLLELPTDAEHMGLIHYDFETDNLFYEAGESRYCVIDFDDAMVHWYAMDIVSAISDLLDQGDEDSQRKIEHFLIGYRSIKHLEETFVQYFPIFQRFADLYKYARLLRTIEGLDIHSSPEWAVSLREKLVGVCRGMRERFSQREVRLRPIDQSNWYACTQLEVTAEQKEVFPVPAIYWLAESAYCGFTPLAIYAGEQLVGLTVYAVDPEDGAYWIMAYMIHHKFQQRGLGLAGMKSLLRTIQEKHACDKIMLGHRMENEVASRMYASLGFAEISRNEDEVIRELQFMG
ncbi:GNAT family N-acetyltransferase [Paenibacillus sp. GCM10012306]|uniref:GNAT family N-acetyltransferase n=1 Tax=Paenibacillus sp. GCM10012306 TaxID=3317342 RepID=UPI003622C9C0